MRGRGDKRWVLKRRQPPRGHGGLGTTHLTLHTTSAQEGGGSSPTCTSSFSSSQSPELLSPQPCIDGSNAHSMDHLILLNTSSRTPPCPPLSDAKDLNRAASSNPGSTVQCHDDKTNHFPLKSSAPPDTSCQPLCTCTSTTSFCFTNLTHTIIHTNKLADNFSLPFSFVQSFQ